MDDTILIGAPTIREAHYLQIILNDFSIASGTSINTIKYQLLFFNTHYAIQSHISRILGFSSSLPSKCWSVWALHGLFEYCVCRWCQLNLWLWSCPWFRPFVEPLVCACWCVVWKTFSLDSSPSLKPLGALEMSQKPLWVCVWSPVIILLFLVTNSLLFS